MKKITDQEQLILISISEYINDNEQNPSVRDIALDLNKSTSTIHYHLVKLKQKKIIDYTKKKRSIVIN